MVKMRGLTFIDPPNERNAKNGTNVNVGYGAKSRNESHTYSGIDCTQSLVRIALKEVTHYTVFSLVRKSWFNTPSIVFSFGFFFDLLSLGFFDFAMANSFSESSFSCRHSQSLYRRFSKTTVAVLFFDNMRIFSQPASNTGLNAEQELLNSVVTVLIPRTSLSIPLSFSSI
jgi:hypothetical protein